MKHQGLGRWFICPIVQATQRNIRIDGFQNWQAVTVKVSSQWPDLFLKSLRILNILSGSKHYIHRHFLAILWNFQINLKFMIFFDLDASLYFVIIFFLLCGSFIYLYIFHWTPYSFLFFPFLFISSLFLWLLNLNDLNLVNSKSKF